jgi:hypothetical protein
VSILGIGNDVNPTTGGGSGGVVGTTIIGSNLSVTRANSAVILGRMSQITNTFGTSYSNLVVVTNSNQNITLAENGDLTAPGAAFKPGGGTWTATSDQRLKSNVETANLDLCYDIVSNIALKRFEWNEIVPGNDRHAMGFIAQEVESVFPKAVIRSQRYGIDDCASLDSWQIIMSLFGAVKRLQADNEDLKARVAALEGT